MSLENVHLKLRDLRINRAMTQRELGEKCGLTQQAINRIEQGQRNIDIDLFVKITNALNIDKNEASELFCELFGHNLFVQDDYRQYFLDYDNNERHHLLVYHYDSLSRSGRDALIEILASLKKLNAVGQREASQRVSELTEIKKYKEDI